MPSVVLLIKLCNDSSPKLNSLAVENNFLLAAYMKGKKYVSTAVWEAVPIWVGAWKLPLTLTFNAWLLSVWNTHKMEKLNMPSEKNLNFIWHLGVPLTSSGTGEAVQREVVSTWAWVTEDKHFYSSHLWGKGRMEVLQGQHSSASCSYKQLSFVYDLLLFVNQNVNTELHYAVFQLMYGLSPDKICISVDFFFF